MNVEWKRSRKVKKVDEWKGKRRRRVKKVDEWKMEEKNKSKESRWMENGREVKK